MRLLNIKIFYINVSIVLLMVFLSGFRPKEHIPIPGETEYLEISEIPRSDEDSRKAKFNSYSVKKQIEIYLYATLKTAPSDTVFGKYLEYNGANKVSDLVSAIDDYDNVSVKDNLISEVWRFDRSCDCVANNEELMSVLESNEVPANPNDDEGDRMAKRGYSWSLFELKKKADPKLKHSRNPNQNSYVD